MFILNFMGRPLNPSTTPTTHTTNCHTRCQQSRPFPAALLRASWCVTSTHTCGRDKTSLSCHLNEKGAKGVRWRRSNFISRNEREKEIEREFAFRLICFIGLFLFGVICFPTSRLTDFIAAASLMLRKKLVTPATSRQVPLLMLGHNGIGTGTVSN